MIVQCAACCQWHIKVIQPELTTNPPGAVDDTHGRSSPLPSNPVYPGPKRRLSGSSGPYSLFHSQAVGSCTVQTCVAAHRQQPADQRSRSITVGVRRHDGRARCVRAQCERAEHCHTWSIARVRCQRALIQGPVKHFQLRHGQVHVPGGPADATGVFTFVDVAAALGHTRRADHVAGVGWHRCQAICRSWAIAS